MSCKKTRPALRSHRAVHSEHNTDVVVLVMFDDPEMKLFLTCSLGLQGVQLDTAKPAPAPKKEAPAA